MNKLLTLKGVGPKTLEHLARLDIHCLTDLLFHCPLRYEDRTRITPISDAQSGRSILIQGAISQLNIFGRKRAQLTFKIADETGQLTVRLFHFTAKQIAALRQEGLILRCFGEVRAGFTGGLEMVHPEYRFVDGDELLPLLDHLTAVYPTTKGLSQTNLRRMIDHALEQLAPPGDQLELLPEEIRAKYQFPTLYDALTYVHHPPADAPVVQLLEGEHPTQARLAFEELLAHQLGLQRIRQRVRSEVAPVLSSNGQMREALLNQLPFSLTQAQCRVGAEINSDLAQPAPMLRLVQGDVGSGKTIVAALAALVAIESGYQALIMAPTELLAEQHLQNFQKWFAPLGIELCFLSGRSQGKSRQATLERIASGQAQLIVGTHALFQAGVNFHKLALIVVDEQHRFGVHQRLALMEKAKQSGCYPHQLIMTATPIPRTLAMTAYADLDYSVIDELPAGRQPIKTILVSNERRDEVIARVRANCLNQRQAYWICTLVEESEALQCEAAQATAEKLQQILSELRVGLVHGRMKADEKEAVMQAFKRGEIHLLVATTVVEVGVDVPQASLMIIENAERLGLAQLHQLRGRVGRGKLESHCVLLYKAPLSYVAQQRLTVMRETTDGFEIAKKDLEMRGPGEVLGTRQSGLLRLRIADLMRDQHLIPDIQAAGEMIIRDFPQCVAPLINRWVGQSQQFADV